MPTLLPSTVPTMEPSPAPTSLPTPLPTPLPTQTPTPLPTPVRWLVGTDAFDMCSKDVATRLYGPLSAAMGELGEVLSAPVETTVCDDGSSLVDWVDVFRVCQGH